MFYPVKLDKMRNFRYGMGAISLLEESLGIPVGKIDFEGLTMKQMATLIWAGLAHEDAELTPDTVMALIDEYSSVAAVSEAAGNALKKAFGAGDEDEKNGKRAKASSTR